MVDIYTPNKQWLDLQLKGCRITKVSIPKELTGECFICDTKLRGTKKKFCSDDCKELCDILTTWAGIRLLTYIRDEGRCVYCNTGTYLRFKKNIYAPPNIGGRSSNGWYRLIDLKEDFRPTLVEHVGDLNRGEIDHLVPLNEGGLAMNLSNLQLLCKRCHDLKSQSENCGRTHKHKGKMTETVVFRINSEEKDELKRVADEVGITLGELCRRSISTIEVLFDPDLTLSKLVELAGILKKQGKKL